MARTTEARFGRAVLEILAGRAGGTASIFTLKKLIPRHLNLTNDDRAASQTRNGEPLWHQSVRNLVSHKNTSGNIVHEGYAVHRPRTLTITDAGRRYIGA